MQFGDGDALLLGAITVTDGDGVVFQGLVIHGDTEWSSDQILTGVALANRSRIFVDDVEVVLEQLHDFLPFFWQTIFLDDG